ncbi:MAG: hypothetical protein FJX76_02935 [Armatimonadetes bacterium]|nr:hypothetical protein [Armatimonadota bacterium]
MQIQPLATTPTRAARPTPPEGEVGVLTNAQDTVVLPNSGQALPGVREGLSTRNVRVSEPVAPTSDGTYVFADSDPRARAALSFSSVVRTVQLFEDAMGQPLKWAFRGSHLDIRPDEGEMLNAYYSRDEGGLSFFHAKDPVTGQVVYSGDSGEVTSHEAGHAILDALRPGWLMAWSPDPAAFHESFGDVVAILVSLHDGPTLDKLVEQTGGDLTKPNLVANNGENMGIVINHTAGKNVTGGDYGRTARNNFKWADPSTLPHRGGPDQLGSESHSFSRLWTGAFYDVLTSLAAANQAAGMSPKDALRAAGDKGVRMYANLMKMAPQGDFTYRELAQAMVRADQKHNGGKNVDVLTKVFTDRQILTPQAGMLSTAPRASRLEFESLPGETDDKLHQVRVKLSGDDFGPFAGAVVENPVDNDGSLTKDAEVSFRVKANVKRLIDEGRIRNDPPGYKLKREDYFDAEGRPYMGATKWIDGQMKIERLPVAT